MVRHPLSPDDLAQLPPLHRKVAQREPLAPEDVPHLNDLDEQGNTVLHRAVAMMDAENPRWDAPTETRPFLRKTPSMEMSINYNQGTFDASTVANLVNGGVDLDVRNADGKTALDLARERYEAIARSHEPGAAATARMGAVTNLLNGYEEHPGPRVDSAASDQAVLDDRLLLRDLVYLDDLDGVKQTWSNMRSPAHDDPATSTKDWLFYDAQTPAMMGVLAKDFGLDPNAKPNNYSSYPYDTNHEPVLHTALQCAVRSGDVERTQGLLANGANPNGTHNLDLEIPLARALDDHNTAMVGALLDAGASMDQWVVHEHFQALDRAIEKQCPAPIVEALLQHGADPNSNGVTPAPLARVTDQHDLAIVDLLIDYGARTKAVGGGETPQFMAAINGDVGVCKRITERVGDPAGIDTPDHLGNTPLAYNLSAIDDDERAIAQRLLDHGASTTKAMESTLWQDAMRKNMGQGTETTTLIARQREGEVLREAAEQAQQDMRDGGEQEEEPVRAKPRRRL